MSALTVKKMKKTANNVSNFPSNNCKKNYYLESISPITPAQRDTFELFKRGLNLILKGSAGTGKTFIAMYLSLKAIMGNAPQNKIIVVRSAVATRDIGALPGDLDEKTGIYELPYYAICHELTDNKNSYSAFKGDGLVTFVPTSYVRGVTFRDSIIIVDEVQNLTFHEIYSIVTRAGENCRFIFCGDLKQTDLSGKGIEKTGFDEFLKIASKMDSFAEVDFTHDDIVRSGLVKEFIIAHETS